ncbi:MAG: hypothetical protein RIQ81_1669 [Pseudomonadota bacterium]|jgi:S-DNA-T family DNA segregation ATPase FtsK/SpoIIIE
MSATTASLRQKLFANLRAAAGSPVLGDVTFLLTAGGAVFLTVALVGFNPRDTAYFAASWPPSMDVSNPAGTVGAMIAQMLVFFFGAGSLLVPLFVAITGWSAWQHRQTDGEFNAVKRTFLNVSGVATNVGFLLLLTVCCTSLASAIGDVTWRGVPLPAGGYLGTSISGGARAALGQAGVWLSCGVLALAAGALITGRAFLFRAGKGLLTTRRGSNETSIPERSSTSIPMTGIEPAAIHHEPESIQVEDYVVASMEEESDNLYEASNEALPGEEADEETHAAVSLRQAPYIIPSTEIFQSAARNPSPVAPPGQKDIDQTAALLVKTFADFGVTGKVIGYQPGPVVTVFEFQPDAGVKQSRILGLIDDLALSLKVDSIFINPVPGKRALGVQVPNTRRETVYLGDLINSDAFRNQASPLVFAMGKSLSGNPVCADLTSMPHLLMAGATGAGKSVAINSLICSIVMKAAPEDVRMILVDPKMLELSVYEGIPHLLMPVITEPDRASHALKWAAAEMERRYRLMQFASVRNIAGFNAFWDQASESRRQELRLAAGTETAGRLPYILLVIDELADLMLTAPKDVESSIQRLAQKARASGIHMVLATQRPSVDIITGVIKANLPCRLSFQVVSKHDSRTILDQVGAEKLLGRGDMLFQRPGSGRLERIQGALVSDEEVLSLVATIKSSGLAAYDDSIMGWIDAELQKERTGDDGSGAGEMDSEEDPKYTDAMQLARSHGVVSASFLQRHLKIGYNRAARMVEHMERCGLVAKADGAKPRRWLGPSA